MYKIFIKIHMIYFLVVIMVTKWFPSLVGNFPEDDVRTSYKSSSGYRTSSSHTLFIKGCFFSLKN